ncbi:MAG: flagellar protein FliS [Opitutales bacterium]|nr:flagellar protein FliS [Opitutales bacterium]
MSSQTTNPYAAHSPSKVEVSKDLLCCYQRIMDACCEHDADGAEYGISILEESLNYKANPELAFYLQRLYTYAKDCLKKEAFDEACRIMQGLRSVWERAALSDSDS